MLQCARKITLAGGAEESSSARLEDVRDYLSRYGVEAQMLRLEGGEPGAAMADLARRDGHDLVVAGARSHGLWRERLFGGATRDLMAARDVNWLMAN